MPDYRIILEKFLAPKRERYANNLKIYEEMPSIQWARITVSF